MRARVVAAVLAIAVVLIPARAWACPVCFGQVEGPMADAINNGILVMLGLVVVVQVGFVAMFVGFWRRSKRLREQAERFTVINGGLQ